MYIILISRSIVVSRVTAPLWRPAACIQRGASAIYVYVAGVGGARCVYVSHSPQGRYAGGRWPHTHGDRRSCPPERCLTSPMPPRYNTGAAVRCRRSAKSPSFSSHSLPNSNTRVLTSRTTFIWMVSPKRDAQAIQEVVNQRGTHSGATHGQVHHQEPQSAGWGWEGHSCEKERHHETGYPALPEGDYSAATGTRSLLDHPGFNLEKKRF